MTDSTTPTRRRKPGKRVRGYQLRVTFLDWKRTDTGLIWLSQPPLSLWHATISQADVRYATLLQSGRVLASYDLMRQRAELAPLNNNNQGFRMMR